mmetsp:Transcript_66405/g.158402  ORF Transcript_66405/g.158402 Transcript_66405/m.158402 type:complete len:240 (+) Transcript_66405:748-1467(+)
MVQAHPSGTASLQRRGVPDPDACLRVDRRSPEESGRGQTRLRQRCILHGSFDRGGCGARSCSNGLRRHQRSLHHRPGGWREAQNQGDQEGAEPGVEGEVRPCRYRRQRHAESASVGQGHDRCRRPDRRNAHSPLYARRQKVRAEVAFAVQGFGNHGRNPPRDQPPETARMGRRRGRRNRPTRLCPPYSRVSRHRCGPRLPRISVLPAARARLRRRHPPRHVPGAAHAARLGHSAAARLL